MAGTGLGHTASAGNAGPQSVNARAVRESQAPIRVALGDNLDDRAPAAGGDTDASALGLPPCAVAGDDDVLSGDPPVSSDSAVTTRSAMVLMRFPFWGDRPFRGG